MNKWIGYLIGNRESERLARVVFGESLAKFCSDAYEIELEPCGKNGIVFSMRELTIDQFKELGEQMAEVLDASPDYSRAFVCAIWGPTLALTWELKVEGVDFQVKLETKYAQGCAINPAKPAGKHSFGRNGELHADCMAILEDI